ncbi:MAG: helix-turn-helix transcriptional regulator [Deltaproteobacteria bacterium]|nr:helix-turn-helix transcriptional regulator [Deltaproteobacteria bacterium]
MARSKATAQTQAKATAKAATTDTPILSSVLRGMLPMFLLTLLDQRARYGSEVMEAFARMSGGAWRPSPGSLYPLLRRLEGEGTIAGEWRSGKAAAKRVYEITARGRQELPTIQKTLLQELLRARALIDTHIAVLKRLTAGEDADGILPQNDDGASDGGANNNGASNDGVTKKAEHEAKVARRRQARGDA